MKGQLPRAYLRLDPNADAHPDLLAMVTLMLEANRQAQRGRFKTLDKLRLLLGRKRLQACLDRGDIRAAEDGTWVLDGWDVWQEGDYTVGERMTRLRDKRNKVTPDDTPELRTERIPDRNPPSEALGVKASGVETEPENERLLSLVGETPNGHGLTQEQRQEYAEAVWMAFVDRTGQSTRVAGPSDWEAIKSWMDRGIPLRVVLRGIQDTKKTGSTLAYYKPSVDDAYDYWRRASA